MPVLDAAQREKRFELRQKLRTLEGNIESIKYTVGAYPEAAHMLAQITDLERSRSKLLAQISKIDTAAQHEPAPEQPGALSVEAAEAELSDLRERMASAESEYQRLSSEIASLERQYHAVAVGNSDGNSDAIDATYQALRRARDQQAEIGERIAALGAAIPAAERALKRAGDARAEREREHWARVATKVEGIQRWCALIRARGGVGNLLNWEDFVGRRPTPSERLGCMAELAERYPFTDSEPTSEGRVDNKLRSKIGDALARMSMTVSGINEALSRNYRVAAIEAELERMEAADLVTRHGNCWRLE